MEILYPIQAGAGCEQAEYVDLVETYGDEIYRLCRALCAAQADAEDLFQDTFLKAFLQHNGRGFAQEPKKYLVSTAIWLWKSARRKYARRQRIAPSAPLQDTLASAEGTPQQLVERREAQQLVRELVAALPEKYRLPTAMYYGAEMPLADIAAALSIPEGTVKSRLHKARRLIETQLEDSPYAI